MELNAKHWMYIFWGYQYLLVLLDEVVLYLFGDFIFYGMAIFVNAFFILAWFLADTKESNYFPNPYFKILVLVFHFILIPYYLVKVKGWKRAGLSFRKFFIYTLVFTVYFYIVDYAGLFSIA